MSTVDESRLEVLRERLVGKSIIGIPSPAHEDHPVALQLSDGRVLSLTDAQVGVHTDEDEEQGRQLHIERPADADAVESEPEAE